MDDLMERVHSLSPKLFSLVLQAFFEVDKAIVQIDKSYRPPVQLQVNSHWRDHYARLYYTRNFFTAGSGLLGIRTYIDWKGCLSIQHGQLIDDAFEARLCAWERAIKLGQPLARIW